MRKIFVLPCLLTVFVKADVAFAQNEVNVFIGQISVISHEVQDPPIRTIEIRSDSVKANDLTNANARYAIYNMGGDCVVPLSIVPSGGISLNDISLCGVGAYRLMVTPQEICTLNLTTDFPDGAPQSKESIPLSPAATYHLDIVVEDDEE